MRRSVANWVRESENPYSACWASVFRGVMRRGVRGVRGSKEKNVVERDDERRPLQRARALEQGGQYTASNVASLHCVAFQPRSEAFGLFLLSQLRGRFKSFRNKMHCIETSVGNKLEASDTRHKQASWSASGRECGRRKRESMKSLRAKTEGAVLVFRLYCLVVQLFPFDEMYVAPPLPSLWSAGSRRPMAMCAQLERSVGKKREELTSRGVGIALHVGIVVTAVRIRVCAETEVAES